MIIAGAVNAASEFHVVKFSLACLLDEEDGAYIFTTQTPRQYAAIPRPEGNLVILVNFIVLWRTLICKNCLVHISVHVVSFYQVKISVGDFL